MTRRVTTYGLDAPGCDVTATEVVLRPLGVEATVKRGVRGAADGAPPAELGRLSLQVPGRHNLQNALAAVAVGLELGLPFERIASGLEEFHGVERRFEVLGEPNGILVVDDYGHHPAEIAATLDAARVLKRRLIVAFQPHRYSRTAALMDAFGPAFAAADHVVLTDIYAAGENPIADVTVDALAAAIRRGTGAPVDVVPFLEDLVPALARIARPGDVVITLGAGSIGSVSRGLLDALAASPIAGDGAKGAGA
jgi:UDP-N-acetylmuramate--alanine ligase